MSENAWEPNLQGFAVGDVVVIIASCVAEYPVGMEVTILEIVGEPWSEDEYLIGTRPPNHRYLAARRGLRKKRPPPQRKELGASDECARKPAVTA